MRKQGYAKRPEAVNNDAIINSFHKRLNLRKFSDFFFSRASQTSILGRILHEKFNVQI